MTRFQFTLLRAKTRLQTTTTMRKYRVRVWWGLEMWQAS